MYNITNIKILVKLHTVIQNLVTHDRWTLYFTDTSVSGLVTSSVLPLLAHITSIGLDLILCYKLESFCLRRVYTHVSNLIALLNLLFLKRHSGTFSSTKFFKIFPFFTAAG